MEVRYSIGEKEYTVAIEREGEGYRATVGGRTYRVEDLRAASGSVTFRLDGRPVVAHVVADGSRQWVAAAGQTAALASPSPAARRRGAGGASGDQLSAVMPGLIRSVPVADGQTVEKGQTLVVLEAMKMEIRVTAPHAGRVRKVLVREGQVVEREQLLVEVAPADG